MKKLNIRWSFASTLKFWRTGSVVGLMIGFLCMSSILSCCQQSKFDGMSQLQLEAEKKQIEKRIEKLYNRQDEASLYEKLASNKELTFNSNLRTIQCFRDKAIILSSNEELLSYAAQSKKLAIEDYFQQLEIINKNLETKFSTLPLNDSSQNSVISLDPTINPSFVRSNRSHSITTVTTVNDCGSHEISSTSSIASDDGSEAPSSNILTSILVKDLVDRKIKAQQAYALSRQSQAIYDAEQEIANKKKKVQLVQHRIAHNEAQKYLKKIAEAAIAKEIKLYKELQKDEKNFLNEEKKLLQSLKDKQQHKQDQDKINFKKVIVELNNKVYSKTQRQKTLLEIQEKKKRDLITLQKQAEEDKFLLKEQVLENSQFSHLIYTLLLQGCVTEDIVKADRTPTEKIDEALYQKIKESMSVFNIEDEYFIRKGIIQPAIQLSTYGSQMNVELATKKWIEYVEFCSSSASQEQINFCKQNFQLIFREASKIRNLINRHNEALSLV